MHLSYLTVFLHNCITVRTAFHDTIFRPYCVNVLFIALRISHCSLYKCMTVLLYCYITASLAELDIFYCLTIFLYHDITVSLSELQISHYLSTLPSILHISHYIAKLQIFYCITGRTADNLTVSQHHCIIAHLSVRQVAHCAIASEIPVSLQHDQTSNLMYTLKQPCCSKWL